jgi:acyl carrier protein
MLLETLPVSANGKIDRKALPVPGRSRPELDTPFVPATTPIEKALVQIWGEILETDEIGIHDTFLDLGGDSLAATRIVSQVFATFQMEIPLQSLFQSSTVAEMAMVITQHENNKLENNELAQILDELESLGEAEARDLLKNTLKPVK